MLVGAEFCNDGGVYGESRSDRSRPVSAVYAAIDPAPTTSSPCENGSVLNLPTANSKSGFDSQLNDESRSGTDIRSAGELIHRCREIFEGRSDRCGL
jgi:hypothetical protein